MDRLGAPSVPARTLGEHYVDVPRHLADNPAVVVFVGELGIDWPLLESLHQHRLAGIVVRRSGPSADVATFPIVFLVVQDVLLGCPAIISRVLHMPADAVHHREVCVGLAGEDVVNVLPRALSGPEAKRGLVRGYARG